MSPTGNDTVSRHLDSLLDALMDPQPRALAEDCWRAIDASIASHRQGQITGEQLEALVATLAAAAISIEANAIVADYFSPLPQRDSMFGLGV